MNILYIGVYDPPQEEQRIIASSPKNVSSGNNAYQNKVIKSIKSIEKCKVRIVNFPSVGSFPKFTRLLFMKSLEWGEYNKQYGGINLPFLRNYVRFLHAKREIRAAINVFGDDFQVIVYNPYNPILKAVSHFNGSIRSTLIVPDMPQFQALQANEGFIIKWIKRRRMIKSYSYFSNFNHFVLMTDYMKEGIVKENQTYSVVEGISDNFKSSPDLLMSSSLSDLVQSKYILYSGRLTAKYGVLDLIEAFKSINHDVKLVICGSGETFEHIKSISQSMNNLVFLGQVTHEESNYLQQNATILVNPRVNSNYTKYSFPSKTIEYLEKNVPVVMHRLDCMPKEYEDFIYFTDEDTVGALTNKLIEVLNEDLDKIIDKTSLGLKYVNENLNYTKQAHKIIGVV